jgi:hypothetical protein
MNGTRCGTKQIRAWAIAIAACGIINGAASARNESDSSVPAYAQQIIEGKSPAGNGVTQTGCCDNLSPAPMITEPISGGCGVGNCPPGCPTGHCLPGRKCPSRCGSCGSCGDGSCDDDCSGRLSRLTSNLFTCFCCTDPCYESQWLPQANAGFFVDHARPQSQMRIRYDAGFDMIMPDRNEFFWAKEGGLGPPKRENTLDYHELSLYTEIATGAFGLFTEMPYRLVEPDVNNFHAGWGDLTIGTKSMFIDCELLQLTFQFKTIIPIGSTSNGFGTGHVTLEPSLLSALKLTHKDYLETQLSEWIPIAGDHDYAGMILHYHMSLNHLWCQRKAIQFVTSLEYFGYVFQDGALTNPASFNGPAFQRSSRDSYHYIGPGCRFVICDNYDIGVGAAFSLTDDHFADQLLRTEIRIRY